MGKKRPVITFNSTSITEGDLLITTLTNLKPRQKFFYALTGDGVDKSDLDSGKVRGRLKASKQGVLSSVTSSQRTTSTKARKPSPSTSSRTRKTGNFLASLKR